MQVGDRALGVLYDPHSRTRSVRSFGQTPVEALREPRADADQHQHRASPPVSQVVEGEWLRRVTAAASRGPSQDASNTNGFAARGAAFYRALSDIEPEADHTSRGQRLDVFA